MNDPVFSIVVPCYNYAHFLGQALESVDRQQRNDVQTIVVDDASQDDTPAVAARFGERIEYVRNEKNLGAAGAWNRGISLARGKYLIKLDADDELLPGHLDAFEAAFEANPDAGMVFSSVLILDEIRGKTGLERLTQQDRVLNSTDFRNLLLSRFFFRMPGSALRMAAIENHEPPDLQLFQVHDWEFFLRVTKGWGAVLMREPYAVYRVHDASITSVARVGNRLENDLAHWIEKSSRPGADELTNREMETLKGSFAIVLVLNRFGSKLDPSTYWRFLRAYALATRLALSGNFGEFLRMNRALAGKLLGLLGKPLKRAHPA